MVFSGRRAIYLKPWSKIWASYSAHLLSGIFVSDSILLVFEHFGMGKSFPSFPLTGARSPEE